MSRFVVSGVYKKAGKTEAVFIHALSDAGVVMQGERRPLHDIIRRLANLDIISLLRWDYEKGVWRITDRLRINHTDEGGVHSHHELVDNDHFEKMPDLTMAGTRE